MLRFEDIPLDAARLKARLQRFLDMPNTVRTRRAIAGEIESFFIDALRDYDIVEKLDLEVVVSPDDPTTLSFLGKNALTVSLLQRMHEEMGRVQDDKLAPN